MQSQVILLGDVFLSTLSYVVNAPKIFANATYESYIKNLTHGAYSPSVIIIFTNKEIPSTTKRIIGLSGINCIGVEEMYNLFYPRNYSSGSPSKDIADSILSIVDVLSNM